jgi:hypothetical protein
MSMFIRVKRKKTTYFVNCEPSETVVDIKQKLHALTDVAADQQRLILLSSRVVLDDNKSLANQKVENDAIVALTLKDDDTGDWEDIQIDKLKHRPNYLVDSE